jgi:hypothetical protein
MVGCEVGVQPLDPTLEATLSTGQTRGGDQFRLPRLGSPGHADLARDVRCGEHDFLRVLVGTTADVD